MSLLDYFRTNKSTRTETSSEERSQTIAGVTVANWDAAYGYGKNVDRISVAYGCVNLRASTIASLPIQLNLVNDNGYTPAIDHEYYKLITRTPNQFQTNYVFWHWVVSQLDLFGNAYIQKIRNGFGTVLELIPLNPQLAEVTILPDGKPSYKFSFTGIDGITTYGQFSDEQIIHIKGYSRNGVYGLSLIDTFRTLFDGYNELENAGTQIAKNAAKPAGVIYHPNNIKEEELNKLRQGWQQGFTSGNSGKTAFLPNTLKVDSVASGLTAQEAEYINQKQFSAQRIVADIFRCPLHMFGLNGSPVYASVEQQAIEFVQFTLTPIITNIEQQMQKSLLGDDDTVCINFNVAGLLRGDVRTRLEYYRFAVEHGIMTSNQVNKMENTGIHIAPQDGGDDFIRPLNFGVIGKPVTPTVRETIAAPSGSLPVIQ